MSGAGQGDEQPKENSGLEDGPTVNSTSVGLMAQRQHRVDNGCSRQKRWRKSGPLKSDALGVR